MAGWQVLQAAEPTYEAVGPCGGTPCALNNAGKNTSPTNTGHRQPAIIYISYRPVVPRPYAYASPVAYERRRPTVTAASNELGVSIVHDES